MIVVAVVTELSTVEHVGSAGSVTKSASSSVKHHHGLLDEVHVIEVTGTIPYRSVHLFRTIVLGRRSHMVGSYEDQTLSIAVAQSEPTCILMVSAILRAHEARELVSHLTLIETHEGRFLTVGIVIPRTASQPSHVVVAFNHFQSETDTGDFHTLSGRIDIRVNSDNTLVRNGVFQLHEEGCRTATTVYIGGCNRGIVLIPVGFNLHVTRCSTHISQFGVIPFSALSTLFIVVSRNTEGVECQRT